MSRKILATAFVCVSVLSSPVMAQEFGATIGIHQTTADSNTSGATVDGKMNFKLGGLVAFELIDQLRFRSGLIYNQRHFEVGTGGNTFEYNFAYFDVPINVQYNFNDTVGLFGGLIVAVNSSDDVEAPAGLTATDPDAEDMVPILNLGVNLLFQDMVGFDIFYERGMGKFADSLENFSTFGLNFNYWF